MRTLAFLALLGACATREDPPVDMPTDPTVVYLTPTQHLVRASMALRGLRPSVDDLRAVEAAPDALPAIVDRYLASPEFGETIKELHNEALLLRVEQPVFTFPAIGALAASTATEINGSVFDEPLRLIEHVVATDRPYSEIVTADYTMADGIVAAIWGLPHTGAFGAWEKTTYTDGRGAGGVLASSVMYHRWRSAGFNYNRGRANTLSRALLCHDFLTSDIAVDTNINLADPDVVANAVVENKACAGCHQTLDPLASYLFTFRNQVNTGNVTAYPVPYFQPEQENRWMRTNKRPPMFFGQPAVGMTGLGQTIAEDPRFARCAAIHFASYFSEVAQQALPGAWIARLQKEFVAGGMSAKQLAKAVVLSDEFRVSHDTDAVKAELVVGALKVRPEQLDRMLADLSGLSWQTTSNARLRGIPVGTAKLLASDFIGFRVLAGGIDSFFVTEAVHTMNATSSLVAKSAAEAAANFVVEHDATAPAAQRTLFREAAVTATGEAAVRAQLAFLHARIYGELVAADAPEVDDTYTLFRDALAATGDAKRAWKITLIGMFRDFRSLFY